MMVAFMLHSGVLTAAFISPGLGLAASAGSAATKASPTMNTMRFMTIPP